MFDPFQHMPKSREYFTNYRKVKWVPREAKDVVQNIQEYLNDRATKPDGFKRYKNVQRYLPSLGKNMHYYEARVAQDRKGRAGKQRVVVLVQNDKILAKFFTKDHYGDDRKHNRVSFQSFR
mmetsp:Transcript_6784/g.25323  ORF Transcript_6784/g.25323 Transcript_6784/m.25323 type:complete len:121 (-) Transcript_6784:81-443(-)